MAFSTTIAEQRGYLSASDRDRIFWLMSRLGLSLNSPYLTPGLLSLATDSIVQTRDGLLRAAVPRPIGNCYFINDLTTEELNRALVLHQRVCRGYLNDGIGEEMFTR
jgi:3-dehydroquinate synthetase